MGLTVLPPDVNASDWAYIGRERTIRMGLMQVKTLADATGQRIVKERARGGPFRSFQEFLSRVKPEQGEARALVRAGCCGVASSLECRLTLHAPGICLV